MNRDFYDKTGESHNFPVLFLLFSKKKTNGNNNGLSEGLPCGTKKGTTTTTMFDDDDDDMMMMSEGDDFSGDAFSDIDDGEEGDEVEETAENLFYQAKSTAEESVEDAMKELRRAVELDGEQERSEFGFKALKKLVKFALRGQAEVPESTVVQDFKSMLGYAGVVSVNMMEKGINTLVDLAAASGRADLTEQLVVLGAASFRENGNDRAWFRINLKLAQTMFDAGRTDTLQQRLDELVRWCELAEGVNDPKKESLLKEVLALQMQSAMARTADGGRSMRHFVARALSIHSAVPHPRTLGIIHECSGKVMMNEHRWPLAKQEFFDAFKNYDESGSPRRLVCLRYLVLAAMLEHSQVNPFETPETKSYAANELIAPALAVWNAFETLDVRTLARALAQSGDAFAQEQFIARFVPLVVRSLQVLKVAQLVKAYSRMRIDYIARELDLPDDQCEALLVGLILDGQLAGEIDQVDHVLLLPANNFDSNDSTNAKYLAMAQWSRHITELVHAVDKKFV